MSGIDLGVASLEGKSHTKELPWLDKRCGIKCNLCHHAFNIQTWVLFLIFMHFSAKIHDIDGASISLLHIQNWSSKRSEQWPGIDPGSSRWQAKVIPLTYLECWGEKSIYWLNIHNELRKILKSLGWKIFFSTLDWKKKFSKHLLIFLSFPYFFH